MRDKEVKHRQLYCPAGLLTIELCQPHEVLQVVVVSKHLHGVETPF